ncbi:DUF6518 family protein [Actinocatenispora rupis]|uniref:Uncharacterized protein n=1 Tax=Actinocatenispora rupis TaxID=519421 RepID=A0A8J3N836_9ACTN|nr:DUF6518 family protein [Actinocatenispora rupis]GID09889.1 hypothetical protein Aru02nite_07780 [Actinocatenispora rupis]
MSTATATTRTPAPAVRRGPVVAVVAVAAGVVLGALDLAGQLALPYPWANLANSAALWAVAAFGLARWVRAGAVRCMVAGTVLLVVAVPVYYLAAALVLHDEVGNAVSAVGLAWTASGVLAGCVFGLAGHLRAVRPPFLAALGVALPSAVLLAEAAQRALRPHRGWDDDAWTAVIQVALAVVLVAAAGRGLRGRALAAALAVPLAAFGWVAFRVAGFA